MTVRTERTFYIVVKVTMPKWSDPSIEPTIGDDIAGEPDIAYGAPTADYYGEVVSVHIGNPVQ